ncbi:MAG: restriction endonuclease subunit S [Cyanobium sp.]
MEGRELPTGWATYCLGEVGGTKGGKPPSKSRADFWEPGTINWTSPKDMKSFDLNTSEDQISDLAASEGGMEVLPSGSVLLVTRSGILAHTFRVAIANSETAINQDIKAVKPMDGLSERFLAYSLKSLEKVVLQSCSKEGTTVASVETKLLEQLPLPLAPLNEQRRIAAKLDTTLAAVDACRQRLDGVADLLKRFRQAVLAAATSGELTREWREERGLEKPKMHPLGEIIKVSSGKFLPAKAMVTSGGVPVYGGNGVNGFHNESNVHEPTLVIGRVGYYCGSVHLSPAKAWVTDNALVVRHNVASTRQKYLYYALQAIDLRENDSSTAQPVVSGSKIYPLRLICPSVEEQDEIVDRVEALFTLADQLEARLAAARKVVDRLTPALLAKAFRGELVPQDPGDEPASVLLERIRAARQAGAGAAKPSRRGRPKAAANPEQLHLDAAPVPSDSLPPDLLTQLLRECGPLSERALLAASALRPEAFLVQLAREQGLGTVRKSRDDGQVLLEAVG